MESSSFLTVNGQEIALTEESNIYKYLVDWEILLVTYCVSTSLNKKLVLEQI
jgi:hypothetical protein